MASNVPPVGPFATEEDHFSGLRWRRWLERFEVYLVAANVTQDAQKRALLLHLAGERVYEIYETLDVPAGYDDLKNALTDKFSPAQNKEYERFNFRKAMQEKEESLDQFCTRLRQLAKFCQFADKEAELKSQLIMGCRSAQLRRKALSEDINLENLLQFGRAKEVAEEQARRMESDSSGAVAERVNKMKKAKPQKMSKKSCYRCGGEYPHQGECPAINKDCRKCGKKGHFSKVCRTRNKSLEE